MAGCVIWRAKDGGRVDGCGDARCELGIDKFAAMLSDAEGTAEQRLRGGGAEADDDARLQARDFRIKPGTAGGDFGCAWFLMNATFAARFPN